MRFGVVAAALLAMTGHAHAIESATIKIELIDGYDYHFELHTQYIADFHFPDQLIGVSSGNRIDYKLTVQPITRQFSLQPAPRAPETNVNVETTSSRISILVSVTSEKRRAKRDIQFLLTPQCKRDPDCLLVKRRPSPNDVSPDSATMTHTISPALQRRFAMLHKLHEEPMRDARSIVWRDGHHHLVANIGSVENGARYLSFKLRLRNMGRYPFAFSEAELRDGDLIRDFLDIQVANTDNGRLPTVLPPGTEIEAVISASTASRLRGNWVLMLLPADDIPAARFRFNDEPALPHAYKRLAVGVSVQAGAAQFDQGGASDLTIARSASLRARYGVFQHFGVEATLTYLSSGQAMFDGGGRLDISGVRLLASGVLTFGDRYAPFLRAGVGVMAATVDDGITDEFSLLGLAAFGAGLDVWLGERFVVGAAIDGAIGNGDLPLELDLGVHVSYAWDFWTTDDQ